MQVVVDAIDPSVLVSACASRQFDFLEMQEQELHNVVIPLDLEVGEPQLASQALSISFKLVGLKYCAPGI